MVVALKYWRLRRAASRLPGPLKLASAAHRRSRGLDASHLVRGADTRRGAGA